MRGSTAGLPTCDKRYYACANDLCFNNEQGALLQVYRAV